MYKLLIVEDEKLLRQGIIHMTQWMEHGYIITGEASNGEEALRCIETSIPDIIISDVVMPVMNGVELTRILREKYPQIQIIILSSHSEFEYVRETLRLGAADYILKQEIDSETILNSLAKVSRNIQHSTVLTDASGNVNNESLQNQLFLSLLSSRNPEMPSVRKIMETSGLKLKEDNLRMITYIPRPLKNMTQNGADSNIAFLKNVLLSASEGLRNLYSFATVENTLVLLFNSTADELKMVSELAHKVIADTFISYNIPLIAVISNLFNGLENLRSNYYFTLKTSEYLFFRPKDQVFLYSYFQDRIVKPKLGYEIIHPFIEKLDFPQLYDEVFRILSASLEAGQYFEVYELKRSLVEVVNFTVFRLNEMGIDIEEIKNVRFEYIQSLESANSFTELTEEFKKIMMSFLSCVEKSRSTRTGESIQRAKVYLQKNFDKEISLSSTADFLNINKNYLSELFKEQTGENFSDYLIRIRIDKAKEILKEKSLPISIIGEQVGYPNSSYFIQLFKKTVGMKPLEYARLFRKA